MVFLYDGGLAPDPGGDHHRRARQRDRADGGRRRGEPINSAALTAIFRHVVADNRAGGWRAITKSRRRRADGGRARGPRSGWIAALGGGSAVRCYAALRRPRSTSRRSASTSSRSSTERRSSSMSQCVRGGLTFLGAGSAPPTSLAADRRTCTPRCRGARRRRRTGTVNRWPEGHRYSAYCRSWRRGVPLGLVAHAAQSAAAQGTLAHGTPSSSFPPVVDRSILDVLGAYGQTAGGFPGDPQVRRSAVAGDAHLTRRRSKASIRCRSDPTPPGWPLWTPVR